VPLPKRRSSTSASSRRTSAGRHGFPPPTITGAKNKRTSSTNPALNAAAHRVASRLGARTLQRELQLLAERARLDLVGLRPEDAHRPSAEASVLGLTSREREVLQLLARGYTNREIAAELVISVKTASVHVTHILRKLDVSSRIDPGTANLQEKLCRA
jgi:DNA-binding NarL/FixJ family response regulator